MNGNLTALIVMQELKLQRIILKIHCSQVSGNGNLLVMQFSKTGQRNSYCLESPPIPSSFSHASQPDSNEHTLGNPINER